MVLLSLKEIVFDCACLPDDSMFGRTLVLPSGFTPFFFLSGGRGRVLTTNSMSLTVLGFFRLCISFQVTFGNLYHLWNLYILSTF